ncbi:N-acyl homoserine lactonase family protein [Zavarzinia compransoris]|uniref:N-acyl homoserine lactonase family protein n=1 Tax=Zavarzinia marina TaxID=2911065 RepID=UPI001F2480B9|nr:N-acyl homoserine lactonase family protein [Zavarzinia marina]MCF4166876.1 N-acyl homoserine lactonase family protein [Zavarzinia marina]
MTAVKRLYVFLVGYEVLPKTVSTRDRGASTIMAEPVCAYLIETERGLVLFDTGVNSDNLKDAALRNRLYPYPAWLAPSIVLPEHELLPQLARIGVAPADIATVVISHSHCDHIGNLRHFRHADIHIQRREYEYAMGPHGNGAVFNSDFDFPDVKWRLHDGDWTVCPGIEAILTDGHMPGHQSLVVTLPSGAVKILVVDAGDLAENFRDEVLPGECIGGEAEALAAIRRIKRIAAERNGEIVLFHDPDYVHALRLAPDFYK